MRGWVRQAEADSGERDDRLTIAECDELKQLRKEKRGVEAGERHSQSGQYIFCPGDRPSPDEPEQVIDHLREQILGVDPVCRVLEPSPSTYFARKRRPKSARRLRDEQLMPLIEESTPSPGPPKGPDGCPVPCRARASRRRMPAPGRAGCTWRSSWTCTRG
ncbi:hypothetical protein AB0L56_18970 [Streptomyces sp. NPDC052079]|uniref:hypothetical protein n=1 Tax=Streptomyces sp. NPDC052079 TaxID=3155526 RepID=UPI0034139D8E